MVATLTAVTLTAGCERVPAPQASGTAVAPAAPASPASPASPAGERAVPDPATRSGPVRLEIPDIGVDTPVMSLGLAADGTVQVPPVQADDPAGWYRDSPVPGRVGPSVLLGHVTVGRYGDGVFRNLSRLRPGARIVVALRGGTSAVFTVDKVKEVAKDRFPTGEVYGDVDRPELRLITCGGTRTDHGYLGNVVVFASLSGAPR
ncbi:class F sortase [Streptomyces laurentii]|uniref:class F sortase n=1 Tax=Streptomyces laurentii TaxID=39478 RepID=UPI003692D53E